MFNKFQDGSTAYCLLKELSQNFLLNLSYLFIVWKNTALQILCLQAINTPMLKVEKQNVLVDLESQYFIISKAKILSEAVIFWKNEGAEFH